jgi:hypothetical protein
MFIGMGGLDMVKFGSFFPGHFCFYYHWGFVGMLHEITGSFQCRFIAVRAFNIGIDEQ